MKTSPRSQKLASVFQTKLPIIVNKFLTPNQIGFLTITGIEISGDLSLVDVFFTTIGGEKEAEKNLNKISRKIVYELLKEVPLRREFQIRWKKDDTGKIISKL